MVHLKQHVRTNSRNINLNVASDIPSFDIIVNGDLYETYPQNSKTNVNGYGSNRSLQTAGKIQNTNALQRAIRDRLYQTTERLQNY